MEGARSLVAQQPGNLSQGEIRLLQIFLRKTAPQMIDDLRETRLFLGEPAGERSEAEAQRFGDRLRPRAPMRQQALDFVNRVGMLAEEQGHHPDILLAWGKADITLWTHKIDGLSESDFIMAAKIDRLANEL